MLAGYASFVLALDLSLAFLWVYQFSGLGLRYFVPSVLDIREYKRFDSIIYWDLRKLSSLFCYVNEHDWNNYVLIAFVEL